MQVEVHVIGGDIAADVPELPYFSELCSSEEGFEFLFQRGVRHIVDSCIEDPDSKQRHRLAEQWQTEAETIFIFFQKLFPRRITGEEIDWFNVAVSAANAVAPALLKEYGRDESQLNWDHLRGMNRIYTPRRTGS